MDNQASFFSKKEIPKSVPAEKYRPVITPAYKYNP